MATDVFDSLIGQVVQEVASAPENSGIRLSKGSIGIYRVVDPKVLDELVGQSIIQVHEIDGPFLELLFSGGGRLRIPFHPDPDAGVESFCISVDGGLAVVVG